MSPTLHTLLTVGLTLAAVLVISTQCRRPWSPIGRLIATSMNVSHARVTAWGLGHVEIGPAFTILDVGCGGGRTVRTLAEAAPEGKVQGVDYSSASVATAKTENAALIREGRVEIRRASVSDLPFPDVTFDLVTAVETHYYWPDLPANLAEIRRILKPGGTFIVIAETFKGQRLGFLLALPMMMLRARSMTLEEHRALFVRAGYADVTIDHAPKGWMCAVGRKPAA